MFRCFLSVLIVLVASSTFVSQALAYHHHLSRHGTNSWSGGYGWGSSVAGGGVVYGSPLIAGPVVGISPWYGGMWYPAPLFIPADALYGPAPVLRMMGLGGSTMTAPAVPFGAGAPAIPNVPAQPVQPNIGAGGFAPGVAAQPIPRVPAVRVSNRQSRNRAQDLMKIGDDYFHKQRYNEAYQRYKDAAVLAPDLGEIFFREGLALTAFGRWELASQALRRGLKLDDSWPRSNFRVDALFDNNKLAKTAQWESLAQAAVAHPHDSDLLFLIGVQLFFDGQRERSRAFFERAKSLDPGNSQHVQLFLDELARPMVGPPRGERQL